MATVRVATDVPRVLDPTRRQDVPSDPDKLPNLGQLGDPSAQAVLRGQPPALPPALPPPDSIKRCGTSPRSDDATQISIKIITETPARPHRQRLPRARGPRPHRRQRRPATRADRPRRARLAYVAVTRAQHHLDLSGLSWIHRHPDGNPAQHETHPPPPLQDRPPHPTTARSRRRSDPLTRRQTITSREDHPNGSDPNCAQRSPTVANQLRSLEQTLNLFRRASMPCSRFAPDTRALAEIGHRT
jgi:ATP-dependent exoDNAse (exonuclease V) beta subunit